MDAAAQWGKSRIKRLRTSTSWPGAKPVTVAAMVRTSGSSNRVKGKSEHAGDKDDRQWTNRGTVLERASSSSDSSDSTIPFM
jgi:hypothetical protein